MLVKVTKHDQSWVVQNFDIKLIYVNILLQTIIFHNLFYDVLHHFDLFCFLFVNLPIKFSLNFGVYYRCNNVFFYKIWPNFPFILSWNLIFLKQKQIVWSINRNRKKNVIPSKKLLSAFKVFVIVIFWSLVFKSTQWFFWLIIVWTSIGWKMSQLIESLSRWSCFRN